MIGMTLGEIIAVLKRKAPTSRVNYDFVYFHPTDVGSYRGYYEDLAIGYSSEGDQPTVEKLLNTLSDAIGHIFTGYKGGEYIMGPDTRVWVANNGETGGTAIVDVVDGQYGDIRLITKVID